MKKTKLILASLCASAMLFSATASFSLVSEKKTYISYESKAERIVDFMKNSDKYYLLNDLIFHQTTYGSYSVMLDYDEKTEDIMVAIWDKENLLLLDKPDILMFDKKDNKYGSLDEVFKKGEGGNYVEVGKTLTGQEPGKFINIYQNILCKFYYENEDKMEMLENLPKQDREMKELFEILKQK